MQEGVKNDCEGFLLCEWIHGDIICKDRQKREVSLGRKMGRSVVEVRCPVCRGLGLPVWSMGELDRQLQTREPAAPQWWLKGGVRSAWEVTGGGGSAS